MTHVWRVLVVDVGEHAAFLGAALRQAGAVVSEVSSAQVALLTLETEPFDQMVTSLDLPDADGYALLLALQREPARFQGLTAIALCPDGEDEGSKRRAMYFIYLTTTRE